MSATMCSLALSLADVRSSWLPQLLVSDEVLAHGAPHCICEVLLVSWQQDPYVDVGSSSTIT